MTEAFDTRFQLVAALDDDDDPLSINDLPKELFVSIFIAVEDLRWVRHTVPCVCKEWADLYRSQDASPLRETLEVDLKKEVEREGAWEVRSSGQLCPVARVAGQERALRRPVFHASRVISWAERRAGSVRKLHLKGKYSGAPEDFSSQDLGRLDAVVGSSLTELRIAGDLRVLCLVPFWESLRNSVTPAGRLRSLVVTSADPSESEVEPLGQLAGSLEELVLSPCNVGERGAYPPAGRLQRFPESFFALTELRRLVLIGFGRITAIPAKISSLKKLEELTLGCWSLSSLPRELGELSGLTKLDLSF